MGRSNLACATPPLALFLLATSCGARTGLLLADRSPEIDAGPDAAIADAPTSDRSDVAEAPTPTPERHLALGFEHTCALDRGEVSCWGNNRNGELGDGTTIDHHRPRVVPGLTNAVGISAGTAFDVGGGTRGSHTCAWLSDGSVRCWGANIDADAAEYEVGSRALSPTLEAGIANAVDVGVSVYHTCVALSSGSVSCWGTYAGDPYCPPVYTPPYSAAPVLLSSTREITHVAAGVDFTCALRSDATVDCWGNGQGGALGDGTIDARIDPAPVRGLDDVAQISAFEGHACALRRDGTVWCWGDNLAGQCGVDTTSETCPNECAAPFACRKHPTRVASLPPARRVTVGAAHTCALLFDGSIACWGGNRSGQLGDGSTRSRSEPARVGDGNDFVDVVSGALHTCARRADGSVWCWGENAAGQLGDGTTTNRTTPVRAI